jgi:hypothetical protein
MLSLNKDSDRKKFTDLPTDRRRVLARDFLISLDMSRQWLDEALAPDAGQVLNHAVSWQRAANLLPRGKTALTPEQRLLVGRTARFIHAEWINATASAMDGLPALQKAVGFTPAQIFEPVEQDSVLRTLLTDASGGKDAAMDQRDVACAYGWMQVCSVLDWLRDNLPQMPPERAQTVLDDFKPLFVLIAQFQDQRENRAASLQAARASATASAEAATDQARKLELWTAFQAGQPLSNTDLMELALHVAEESAAPTKDAPPDKNKDKGHDKDERKAPRPRSKK